MKKRKNPTMIGKILKNAELIENSHCRPGSNDQQNHSSHLVRFADVFSEPYTSQFPRNALLTNSYIWFFFIATQFSARAMETIDKLL